MISDDSVLKGRSTSVDLSYNSCLFCWDEVDVLFSGTLKSSESSAEYGKMGDIGKE